MPSIRPISETKQTYKRFEQEYCSRTEKTTFSIHIKANAFPEQRTKQAKRMFSPPIDSYSCLLPISTTFTVHLTDRSIDRFPSTRSESSYSIKYEEQTPKILNVILELRNIDRSTYPVSSSIDLHDLRKYFNTNLKMARVNDPRFNETLIEYWMGHPLGKVRGAYFIPPVEEQLRLYKQAEERLEPIFEEAGMSEGDNT